MIRRRQQHPCRVETHYLIWLCLVAFSNSFQTPMSLSRTSSSSSLPSSLIATTKAVSSPYHLSSSSSIALSDSRQPNESDDTTIWEPKLRQIMGGIASVGAIETGYLTYNKLFQQLDVPFCGASVTGDGVGGGCNDILNGPYSYVPFTNIPLVEIICCMLNIQFLSRQQMQSHP